MIKILQPKIISGNETHSRLSCDVIVDGEIRNIWFEVEKEYEQYLCYERSDAFLIGLLSWAMRLNHDIECVAPVNEELLYNITTYVIPSLTKYGKKLYNIKITAPLNNSSFDTAKAVGTGCSCGVDSFHAILNNLNSKYSDCKLTHLCLNNVGSFGRSNNSHHIERGLIESRIEAARNVGKELGLKVIITNSNFADVFVQDHLLTNTYSSVFAIYCLQKLWKTYFYASLGCDFSKFNLKNNDLRDSGYIDLLLLNAFSNRNLRIYSEGGALTRLEKIRNIADSKIVQNNLHVCFAKIHNCRKCIKCKKTMLMLYAIGKLDKFSNVFDVEYFKKHKDDYLDYLYILHIKRDPITKEIYCLLKNDITLLLKIKSVLCACYRVAKKQIRILKEKLNFIL